jgi:hypothetical protein
MDVPKEQERIELVFYERQPRPSTANEPDLVKPTPTPKGRWVLAKRFEPTCFCVAQFPNGDLFGINTDQKPMRSADGVNWSKILVGSLPGHVSGNTLGGSVYGILRSGRWLVARHVNDPPGPLKYEPLYQVVGERDGYPLVSHTRQHVPWALEVWHSDDQGDHWHKGGPRSGLSRGTANRSMFREPLQWATPFGRFIELEDGTVLLTVYGTLTPEDDETYSGCNGIFRSTDGGKTWGDFSVIFRHGPKSPEDPQAEPRYTELDVLPLDDGRWLAVSRTEFAYQGPKGIAGHLFRSFSEDRGRTWSPPEARLNPVGAQNKLVALPDGGIFIADRCTGYQEPGGYITYDQMRTISYCVAGPYGVSNAFRIGDDRILVYATGNGGFKENTAVIYRWVPNK